MLSQLIILLKKKNLNDGFTLLELLITVIIIGILASIAVPQILAQVAKARETEAVSGLAAINRVQIAYRFEHGIFGLIGEFGPDGVTTEPEIEIPLNPRYFSYKDIPKPGTDEVRVKYGAKPTGKWAEQLKSYTGGVRQMPNSDVFATVICRANNHTENNLIDIRPILANDTWGCFGNSHPIR